MVLKYVVSDFAILINLDFIIKRTLGIKSKKPPIGGFPCLSSTNRYRVNRQTISNGSHHTL